MNNLQCTYCSRSRSVNIHPQSQVKIKLSLCPSTAVRRWLGAVGVKL